MQRLTLARRAALYNRAFPEFPDSHLRASERWIHGEWVLGNNYRGTGLYGSYPPGYLKRVSALFPDADHTLHLFAGSVPQAATRAKVMVDIRVTDKVRPGVQGDVLALPFVEHAFDLGIADPPYSDADAERYATPMPDRRKVLYEAHRVIAPGGFLVWLDCTMPMYSKVYWNWCGAIGMWRSTNHRIRGVMLFERLPLVGEIYPGDARPVNLFAEV